MVVDAITVNQTLYSAVISNHNVAGYLQDSRMDNEGVWGSEVEIFVAATVLRTPVAIYAPFGDRHLWQIFQPLETSSDSAGSSSTPEETCMLYLQNSNNHFEPVIAV